LLLLLLLFVVTEDVLSPNEKPDLSFCHRRSNGAIVTSSGNDSLDEWKPLGKPSGRSKIALLPNQNLEILWDCSPL